MTTQNLVTANNDRNANYRLYKGFAFLGGFENILQAKQYANSIEQENYHSVYTLKGENYTDQWSVIKEQTPEITEVVATENENSVYEMQTILDQKIAEIAAILETMPDNSKTLQKVNLIKALDHLQNYANGINADDFIIPKEQPIPTHQEIYDMMFAGISLQAILDLPIKFTSEKEVFDFWQLANRVTTNPCILERNQPHTANILNTKHMENFTYLSDEQFAAIELAETQLVTVNKNITALTVMLTQANQKNNKIALADSVKFSKMLNDMQAKKSELLIIINQ